MQTDSKERLRKPVGFLSLNKDTVSRSLGTWQGTLSWHGGCFSEDVFQVFNVDADGLS